MGAPIVLDALALQNGSNRVSGPNSVHNFGRQLTQALKSDGFVVLRNHGILTSSISRMFEAHRQFFALPLEMKMSIPHPGGTAPARGYSPYGKEKSFVLRPDISRPPLKAFDAREQMTVGPPEDKEWSTPSLPDEAAPGLDTVFNDFYKECRSTCQAIVEALELGLSLPPRTFLDRYLPDAAELSLNHYPSIPLSQLQKPEVKRIWPHSDLGIITILFQDHVGGLQFEDRTYPG